MAVGVVGETAIVGIDEGLDSYDNDQTHNERKNTITVVMTNTHKTHNTHHEENINLYIDIVEYHNDPPSSSTTDQELSIPR